MLSNLVSLFLEQQTSRVGNHNISIVEDWRQCVDCVAWTLWLYNIVYMYTSGGRKGPLPIRGLKPWKQAPAAVASLAPWRFIVLLTQRITADSRAQNRYRAQSLGCFMLLWKNGLTSASYKQRFCPSGQLRGRRAVDVRKVPWTQGLLLRSHCLSISFRIIRVTIRIRSK